MRNGIRHLSMLAGLGLALTTLAACGHRDQRLVDQYFNAVNAKDNQTLGSFAAVGFDKKVDRWRIAKESDEEKAPIPLTDLIAKQKELEKAVAENKKAATAYSMDHYAEVDQVREARKAGKPVPGKLQGVAAEWDKYNQKDRDLKKALADATAAVEKEKRNLERSLGPTENAEGLSGDMLTKRLDLVLTINGQDQPYVMTLRKYDIKGSARPRWVVHDLKPA
jgi:septal ring factor EnvC (AmiA/AmiB activator)